MMAFLTSTIWSGPVGWFKMLWLKTNKIGRVCAREKEREEENEIERKGEKRGEKKGVRES